MPRATTAEVAGSDGSLIRRAITALLPALAAVAVYGRVGTFGFISMDDSDYVVQNGHVLGGPTREGVVWALTTFHAANWHPLTWLSLMLDARIGGGAPAAFHVTNLVLHATNAALLALLFERMTGARWRSVLVATLFAVHPLHVESVAWIAERKDVLSTAIGLLALHAWVGATSERSAVRTAAVATLYAASLMAKPMLVTLPVLLLLLDAWPLGRAPAAGNPRIRALAWRRLVLEKWPFIVIAAASSAVTLAAQASGGTTQSLAHYPLAGRVANAAVTCVAYLVKAAWPSGLAVYYPYPYGGIPAIETVSAVAILAVTTYAALRARASRPYLAFGWLWYLVTLLPVIGLVQVGSQAMADRYTYLPLVGPFVIVAWGLGEIVERGSAAGFRFVRVLAPAFALAGVLVLASTAQHEAAYWKDSVALFTRAIAVTRDNASAHDALASALYERGDVAGALAHCTAALRIAPELGRVQAKLVRCLLAEGNLGEASARTREFLAARPDDADMVVNAGLVDLLSQRPDEAAARFRQALRLDPKNAIAHLNLGALLLKRGLRDEAIAHFEEGVALRPGDAAARAALARAREAGDR
jgi:protein O-mannosyl-transferase